MQELRQGLPAWTPGCVLGLWLSRNLEAVPRVNRTDRVGGRGQRHQGTQRLAWS